MDTYTFATSRQIDYPVCLRINTLEGKQSTIPQSVLLKHPEIRHIGSIQNPVSELYATVQLWAESKPLGVSVQTPHMFFKNNRTWNKWLELPVPVKDCPASSQVAITIWDLSPCPINGSVDHSVPFAGTTIPLFDDDGALRRGRQKCRMYRKKIADGHLPSTTPHIPRPKRRRRNEEPPEASPEEEELERLEQLFKKHEMNEIPQNDWLDQLVFQKVGKKAREVDEAATKRLSMRKAAKRRFSKDESSKVMAGGLLDQHDSDMSDSESEREDDEHFTLYIDLPRWDFPVIFEDHEYNPPRLMKEFQSNLSASMMGSKSPPEVRYGPGIATGTSVVDGDEYPVVQIFDPEQFQRENPCESKHRRLVRSDRNALYDVDQKPNAKLRDEINEILSYGPTQELTPQEKDVIWTFRRHLSRDKRALTKVVKATDWNSPSEARQIAELIPKWAKIDVDFALELLGPTYDSAVVRAYAVDRLRQAGDAELLLYLLQLVQALKFEQYDSQAETLPSSSLARFLIDRAANNFVLGNYLHWYLMVECDDQGPDTNAANRKLFARVEYHFMVELEKRAPEQRKTLLRQAEMIAVLSRISKEIRFNRSNRIQKIEMLKKYLADPKHELIKIDPPIPLPLDPEVEVSGIFPEEANVFKSSLSPLLLNFKIAGPVDAGSSATQTRSQIQGKYPMMFKTGDDLRQDQLVIQIIELMNNLLLKENLDLKLTPYRILATSPTAGAVQFIPSTAISAVSAKYKGSVLAYLRANNPDASGPLGVRKEAMDTYIRSCAGYCVITYILGVGDRHLDNLLLQPSGHFFHIDFGFILGRDPKPFAPLIKLCKEMVEGLGGTTSPQYAQFKQYCFTAYTTLRKSSSLVLNLFSLMVQSSVQDIRLVEEQMGGIGGAVGKVRERFHLDVSEEEAVRLLDQVLADSVNAVFGVVIDRLHEFVQGWRA
ncbi:Phosphatidylinositol (PI) 3-kinase [Knufia peltigerae]|uniref:Phosphatidylinositol 3-kinase VPS34 n=1 Tax=Knufia peltigerae TaxID=1002370 RepID=A0AA38YEH8_9EURO|nr:Phosphatidylinositol (PI) 3-kinase [Knufia peltigerae]